MGEQYKLQLDGSCPACKVVAVTKENAQCFMCKASFHCACPEASEDAKVGTASLITAFNRTSTKANFKFYCDVCVANMEINIAKSESERIRVLESNIDSIKSELAEIKNLLKSPSVAKPTVSKSPDENIWFNQERLATTKVPPAKPVLLVNNIQESNNESIEKVIIDNGIPVTKSYKNNSGDLVLICDTADSRERLKTAIASSSETVQMKTVGSKKPSITIVGLSQQYTKEEVVKQIVSQNQFVKDFSTANNIDEHIEVHDIKPTRAKPMVFQAFVSVSEVLRNGFRNYRDKVTIGLTSCKIYDRFHVKRCNNCQVLGHFYKDCPTPTQACCAKCSLNHPTNSCNTTDRKCANCVKEGNENHEHATFDPKCPSMLKIVDKKKKAYETHLNSPRATMAHHH